MAQCRSLLDGIDGASRDASSSSYLQNIISEGRCVICNHSTFEEDMQEHKAQALAQQQRASSSASANSNAGGGASGGADEEGGSAAASAAAASAALEDEVILCDGCNAEAHMKCLNMTAVS